MMAHQSVANNCHSMVPSFFQNKITVVIQDDSVELPRYVMYDKESLIDYTKSVNAGLEIDKSSSTGSTRVSGLMEEESCFVLRIDRLRRLYAMVSCCSCYRFEFYNSTMTCGRAKERIVLCYANLHLVYKVQY